ncbi:hypothetical protein ACOSQ2_019958 [Xanthoceras sorbifolium]
MSCFSMEKLALILVIIFTSLYVIVSSSFNVPAIFTFGDSIFDAGNNHFNKNCTAQADFPPYGSSFFHHPTGRFTNGRTVADFISQFIGVELQEPYMEAHIAVKNGSRRNYPKNGINFASAGSGVLRETNQDWEVISIQDQLQQFQDLVNQNKIDKTLVQKSLFLFESGSNDIYNYFLPFGTKKPDKDAYVQAMLAEVANLVDQLFRHGARRIALFSLGPVGCVPARVMLPGAPVDRCYGKLNVMVKKYNKGLENLVMDIPVKYPGAVAVYGASYDLVQKFRANPTRYGFSDVSSACCGDGILGGLVQCGREGYKMCKNPNEFLFWDFFHPSEHTCKLVSKALWAGKQSKIIRPVNLMNLANLNYTAQEEVLNFIKSLPSIAEQSTLCVVIDLTGPLALHCFFLVFGQSDELLGPKCLSTLISSNMAFSLAAAAGFHSSSCTTPLQNHNRVLNKFPRIRSQSFKDDQQVLLVLTKELVELALLEPKLSLRRGSNVLPKNSNPPSCASYLPSQVLKRGSIPSIHEGRTQLQLRRDCQR